MLFKKHKLSLKSCINNETQDGKRFIDSHFAIALRYVLDHVNMGSNVMTPMESYNALKSYGGAGNAVVGMFDLDRPFVDEFTKKHTTTLEFFSKIKRCNEIIFSDKSIVVCKHSGFNGTKVDMSDPTDPIDEIPDNPAVEEDSDAEFKDEIEEANVVCYLGEEEEYNEEFVDCRGNLNKCTFTTEVLSVHQMRKGK